MQPIANPQVRIPQAALCCGHMTYGRSISGLRLIARVLRGPTLYFIRGEDAPPETPPVPDSRRAAVAGLVVTVLLVLGGLYLVHVLNRAGKLQDCVMSGRTDCAPITSPEGSSG